MMTTLLVVDDEEEIRLGMRDLINWQENDISICGVAENGQVALDLIRQYQPDLALVDIKMPVMGGIELLKEIEREHLDIRSIVMSGYDEFEFAQNAIHYGALDYLLKPCAPEEVLEAVLRGKAAVEEERQRTALFSKYYREIQKNSRLLKEHQLRALLGGEIESTELLKSNNDLLQSSLGVDDLLVTLIHAENHALLTEAGEFTELEVMIEAMKAEAERFLSRKAGNKAFELTKYENDVVILFSDVNNTDEVEPLLIELSEGLQNTLWFPVILGVGTVVPTIEKAALSYVKAKDALRHRFYEAKNTLFLYRGSGVKHRGKGSYPLNVEKGIVNSLVGGKSDVMESYLDTLLETFGRRDAHIPQKFVLNHYLQLHTQVYHICLERRIDVDSELSEAKATVHHYFGAESLSSYHEILTRLCRTVFTALHHRKHTNHLVRTALDYIHANYSKDIYLDLIAEEVGITSGYLCSLFKRSEGVNFLEYLHRYRVDKAVLLLQDTTDRIYQIAEAVGYRDEKYFTQVFKKYMGVTPSEFRNSGN